MGIQYHFDICNNSVNCYAKIEFYAIKELLLQKMGYLFDGYDLQTIKYYYVPLYGVVNSNRLDEILKWYEDYHYEDYYDKEGYYEDLENEYIYIQAQYDYLYSIDILLKRYSNGNKIYHIPTYRRMIHKTGNIKESDEFKMIIDTFVIKNKIESIKPTNDKINEEECIKSLEVLKAYLQNN